MENVRPNPAGLHIGRLLESYPMFDSSDAGDSRSYDNYVFSRQPLTGAKMDQYYEQVSAPFNFCMVHEHIPESLLPILYYDGDSNNVLLASAKSKVHAALNRKSREDEFKAQLLEKKRYYKPNRHSNVVSSEDDIFQVGGGGYVQFYPEDIEKMKSMTVQERKKYKSELLNNGRYTR